MMTLCACSVQRAVTKLVGAVHRDAVFCQGRNDTSITTETTDVHCNSTTIVSIEFLQQQLYRKYVDCKQQMEFETQRGGGMLRQQK